MPYICCTQKLAKELGAKLFSPIDQKEGLGNWYANLLHIGRRKCVLFTHEQTLYSLFVPGLKKPEFKRLDDIFLMTLADHLHHDGFEPASIKNILDGYTGRLEFAKTENKSVLGSMNDLAYQIKIEVQIQKGLANIDLVAVTKKLNRIPFKAIGFEYPRTIFKSKTENAIKNICS